MSGKFGHLATSQNTMSGKSGVPTACIISKVALSLLRAAVFTTMFIQDMFTCVWLFKQGGKITLGVFEGLLFKLMATPFEGIVLTGLGPESALRVLGAPHKEN